MFDSFVWDSLSCKEWQGARNQKWKYVYSWIRTSNLPHWKLTLHLRSLSNANRDVSHWLEIVHKHDISKCVWGVDRGRSLSSHHPETPSAQPYPPFFSERREQFFIPPKFIFPSPLPSSSLSSSNPSSHPSLLHCPPPHVWQYMYQMIMVGHIHANF